MLKCNGYCNRLAKTYRINTTYRRKELKMFTKCNITTLNALNMAEI